MLFNGVKHIVEVPISGFTLRHRVQLLARIAARLGTIVAVGFESLKRIFVTCLLLVQPEIASAFWKANVDLRLLEGDGSYLYLAGMPLGATESHVRLISFDPVKRGPASALDLPLLSDATTLALGNSQGASILLLADSNGRAALVRADGGGRLELLDQADLGSYLGGEPPVAANSMLEPSHFVIATAARLLFLPWDTRLRPLYSASIRPPGTITDLENVQARYIGFDRGPLGLIEARFLRPVDIPGPNQTVDLASAPKMLGEVFRIDRSNDTLYFFIDGVKRYYYAYVTNTNVRQPFFEVDLGGIAYDLAVYNAASRQVGFLVWSDAAPEQSLVLGGGYPEIGLSFEAIGSATSVARPFVSLFPTFLTRPEDKIHIRVELPGGGPLVSEPLAQIRTAQGETRSVHELLQLQDAGPPRSLTVAEWQIDPSSLGQPRFTLEVSYPLPDGGTISDQQDYILPWLFPATH